MFFCILFVEDDICLFMLIVGYLCKNDYEVDIVLYGDVVVLVILFICFDFVIFDVNLLGKDGFEICCEVCK